MRRVEYRPASAGPFGRVETRRQFAGSPVPDATPRASEQVDKQPQRHRWSIGAKQPLIDRARAIGVKRRPAQKLLVEGQLRPLELSFLGCVERVVVEE
jgi:hypothetical protein